MIRESLPMNKENNRQRRKGHGSVSAFFTARVKPRVPMTIIIARLAQIVEETLPAPICGGLSQSKQPL